MEGGLLQALGDGATLVTANQRLFRILRERYDRAMADAGARVWESPDILPYGAWLRRAVDDALYRGTAPTPLLFGGTARAVLWEQIIAEHTPGRPPLNLPSTAAAALDAWNRLHQWHLPPGPWPGEASLEVRTFAEWCAAYDDRCAAAGWLDEARLPDHVAGAVQAGTVTAPGLLLLAGFDEFNPQQLALWQVLRGAGCTVREVPFPALRQRVTRHAAADAATELDSAVWWARERVASDPSARIGIVVPDLPQRRGAVEQALQDLFTPQHVLDPDPGPSGLFNISEGLPLAQVPLLAGALNLLALGRHTLRLEQAGRLLRSPFVGHSETEQVPRAALDRRLRERGEVAFSPRLLLRLARGGTEDGEPRPWHCPRLAALLSAALKVREGLPNRAAPSAWARGFGDMAGAMGWPGERPLSSPEYQAMQHWQGLLDELATLDGVLPACTYEEALTRLTRIAEQGVFQPESRPAPVQVLGLLEAGGLEFDALWVLGLDDEHWPRRVAPSPFLPLGLQRQHAMPGASPAHELSYAERITTRLCGAAPAVVLSHALQDEDRGLRPSPLIAALPLAEPPFPPPPAESRLWTVLRNGAAVALEPLVDEAAPPLPSGAASVGGTGVFRDQAACPFRAFALHRLHAAPLEEPSYGISPGERGNIVHGVMQRVWERLGSQAELLATDEATLRALVNDAIAAELAATAAQQPSLMPPMLQRTETARISGIVLALLALEQERAPFTVAALEEAHEAAFGGVTVRTRIDRIDELADGSHVVIDYKTGATTPSSSAWFGERPDEPQLPLYCASGELHVRAVAFGALRRGDTRFVGLGDADGLLPGLRRFEAAKDPQAQATFASREAVIDHWRAALERLGAGFRQGVAWVDPRDPSTCKNCPLPGLCRIDEWRGPVVDADSDALGEVGDD